MIEPEDLEIGALAGVAATGPMTMTMTAMHRLLPAAEQHSLAPRHIAETLADRTVGRLSERKRFALTLASHFAYGGSAGAPYALLNRYIPLPPAVSGSVYGLLVWAASYLGFLPALGIFPSAMQETRRRNVLMVVAHLVWGASLGVIVDELQRSRRESLAGGSANGKHR